ncbi:MAG: cytochrome b N-terminal domain-containing protein [Chloroflexi bacterium]|nr:cytochrome b N-terminal domain-containing protein [Chloroflexota bacterium]
MINALRQRLNIPPREEWRERIFEMIDNRVRIITAGLSIKELRAVLRGDPPTEKPNPRYKVITTSFIAHLRPRYYQQAATWFTHTFRLGWFTTFMFVVETITGVVLMFYYIPYPDQAYGSILAIESNVFFGELLRDLHRLGAEGMVLFSWLHLLRTYFTGSYKGPRSFTWLTGVILLLITAWLSFSGYLLPWDQLAYWAVTVGSSITESGPVVGPALNLIMRGAPDIGTGGLLRFYLQHVILFPLLAILFISIHYYKVAREHSISLPAVVEEGELEPDEKKEYTRRIDLIPDLLTHELFLTALGIFVMLAILYFRWFHSPLETHANPQQTPLDTKAPWYFWWLQGMLKIDPATILENMLAFVGIKVELSHLLNSKFIMGLIIPPTLVLILMGIPYIDRNPSRLASKRPFAIAWGLAWIFIVVAWSYMGTPQYGIETPAATRIIQDLAPEEGEGELREIPYPELQAGIGVYTVGEEIEGDLCPNLVYQPNPDIDPNEIVFGCPHLTAVFAEYSERLLEAQADGRLPDLHATFIVQQFQDQLIRIEPHVEWSDPETGSPKTYSQHFYLHEDRAVE